MPSRQAMRCDQMMVTAIAATVTTSPEICLTATNVASGNERRNTRVSAEVLVLAAVATSTRGAVLALPRV